MKQYELLYIIQNIYSDDEVAKIAEKIREIITKNGGKLIKSDTMGKRRLAYDIKHQSHGTYMLEQFEGQAEANKNITEALNLTEEVLRSQIVDFDPDWHTLQPGYEAGKQLSTSDEPEEEKPKEKKSAKKKGDSVGDATTTKAEEKKEEKKPTEKKKEVKEEDSLEKLDEKLDNLLKGSDLKM